MHLEDTLFQFLDKYHDKKSPLLLGLSGGPDSLTLFHLLLEHKHKNNLSFGVAHVDHGWREESDEEAQQLQKLATERHIPFHLKKLDIKCLDGNLEEKCREERLTFFSFLCKEYGYQAVILGHHADDQSETILKKVLEGGSLPYLGGMSACSSYKALNLWRPLLTCSKLQIRQWLKERAYVPFEDRTNLDKKFLRGRFRTQIIPQLSEHFGKEIGSSLSRIGVEAQELRTYLDIQLEGYIQNIVRGPFGSYLDLSANCPKFNFEIKYLIRKVCEMEGVQLSHHLIDEVNQKIVARSANCRFFAKGIHVHLDRGKLFVMKKPLPEFNIEIPLKLGSYSIHGWNIVVKETQDSCSSIILSGWREAWRGYLQVQIPFGNYLLKKGDKSLSKWWCNEKIPAFMRKAFPVIWSQNAIVHEFLTKRSYSQFKNFEKSISITIATSNGQ